MQIKKLIFANSVKRENYCEITAQLAIKNMALSRQEIQVQFRSDQNFVNFVVDGKATGKKLGCGSYGSVEEVSHLENLKT